MRDWPSMHLEALCDVTSSKRIYAKELVPSGVPFLKSKEIIEKVTGQVHSNLLFISEERFQQILDQTGAPEMGDVLLTSRGTLGVPYVVSATDRFHFADGNLTWFRNFDGLDSRYLSYFFLSPLGKAELAKCVIGSSQAAYTIAALKKVKISVPSLAIQQRIVGILSAYDELIENSQRRIRVLEAMAHVLYREWFVHFRFPGHENCPYVDSELGKIPEGWEVKPFSELATYLNGYAFKPAQLGDQGKPIIKIKQLKAGVTADTPRNSGETIPEKYNIHDGDVLFSWSAHLDAYLWMGGDGLLNQHLFKVIPADGFTHAFCFHALAEAMPRFRALSLGATMQHIKRSALDQVSTVVPDELLRRRFSEFVEPLHCQQIVVNKQIQNLRHTRDLLLPRLLSGQLELEVA